MTDSTALARRVYTGAAVYGILALVPQYFSEGKIARMFPPAIAHPEYFYGFAGVALVWQFAFLLIARDPVRYRPLMPITWLEKLSFGAACVVLFAQGRLHPATLFFGVFDMSLGLLFVWAYLRTPDRDARFAAA